MSHCNRERRVRCPTVIREEGEISHCNRERRVRGPTVIERGG